MDRGGEMKIQNIIRTQAIVIALGAALLLAGSLRAQEIDNVSFDEGPNSIPMGQAVPAPKASTPAAANSQVPNANAEAETQFVSEEVVSSQITPVDRWSMAALLVCIALGALYLRAIAYRGSRTPTHLSTSAVDSKTA
jgi:hypothetical protein